MAWSACGSFPPAIRAARPAEPHRDMGTQKAAEGKAPCRVGGQCLTTPPCALPGPASLRACRVSAPRRACPAPCRSHVGVPACERPTRSAPACDQPRSTCRGPLGVLPCLVPVLGPRLPRHPRGLLRLSLPFGSQAGCLDEQKCSTSVEPGWQGLVADAMSLLLRRLSPAVTMSSGVSVGAAPMLSAPCAGAGFRDVCGGSFAASLRVSPTRGLRAARAERLFRPFLGLLFSPTLPSAPGGPCGFLRPVSLVHLSFLLVSLYCSLSVLIDF